MSEDDLEVFDDTDFSHNQSTNKRPTFIIVLAIMSWLYVAIGVLGGVYGSLSSQEAQTKQMDEAIAIYENMDDIPFQDDMIAYMVAMKDNLKINNLGQMFFLLLEGIAVYMMFQLKRNGFWLYTLAQIGVLGVMFYILPFPNLMSTLVLVMYIFIVLLFEILYAVNLKHMNS